MEGTTLEQALKELTELLNENPSYKDYVIRFQYNVCSPSKEVVIKVNNLEKAIYLSYKEITYTFK